MDNMGVGAVEKTSIISPDVTLTGAQILFVRRSLKMSQMEMSSLLAMPQSSFNRYENDQSPQQTPYVLLIAMLAREAGVEIPSAEDAMEKAEALIAQQRADRADARKLARRKSREEVAA